MRFEFEFPPSTNNLWIPVKGRGLVKTKEYRAWQDANAWIIRQQIGLVKIDGPFEVRFAFQRPDRRKRDLDNLLKASLDCIVNARVVHDDHLCQKLTAEWINKNGRTVYCEIFSRSKDGIDTEIQSGSTTN
jgi:crossover junction endodeoxyribonuclease RusA